FNGPYGACSSCDGLGTKTEDDLDAVIPDWDRSLNDLALIAWKPISSKYYPQLLKSVCEHYEIDLYISLKYIPEEQMNKILYGSGREKIRFHYVNDYGRKHDQMILFEGVLNNIARRYRETTSDFIREKLENYMAQKACPTCDGYRLNEEALSVKI